VNGGVGVSGFVYFVYADASSSLVLGVGGRWRLPVNWGGEYTMIFVDGAGVASLAVWCEQSGRACAGDASPASRSVATSASGSSRSSSAEQLEPGRSGSCASSVSLAKLHPPEWPAHVMPLQQQHPQRIHWSRAVAGAGAAW
jgi:hypothetical protein